MSLFDNIFSKIKNISLPLRGFFTNKERFSPLDDSFFPYACLVDKETVLTKNGEIFQVIEIDLNDFRLNGENGIRNAVRNAINTTVKDLETFFWIHTIKRNITTNHELVNKEIRNELIKDSFFLKKINQEYTMKENFLNNYSIIVCISIFRKISKNNNNFKFKKIINRIKDIFIFNRTVMRINTETELLKTISLSILEKLNIYKPKILSVYEKEGYEYSETCSFLNFLANLKNEPFPIKDIDISKDINESLFLFNRGNIKIKNIQDQKTKNLNLFSIKENPKISINAILDIFSIPSEFIISEYLEYIDSKLVHKEFETQNMLYNVSKNKNFLKVSNLDFLSSIDNSNKYCRSSILLTLITDSKEINDSTIKAIVMKFNEYGIVLTMEDISNERRFYSMMPGNFRFINRCNVHSADTICPFIYSYTPKESDISNFMLNRVICKFGTTKGNPVDFGIHHDKKNIIICGPQFGGKTVLSNFILAKSKSTFDNIRIYSIELKNRSKSFFEAISGSYCQVSTKKLTNTSYFNPIGMILRYDIETRKKYLQDFILFLMNFSDIVLTPEIMSNIDTIVSKIAEIESKNIQEIENTALHTIRNIFTDSILDDQLQQWHSIGKYYHIFDNKQDIILNNNSCGIYFDQTISNNINLLSIIIYHIIMTIILSNSKDQITFLCLEEPFMLFRHPFFKNKLDQIIDLAEKNNIIFIFKIENLLLESGTIVDFTKLISSVGTEFYLGNKHATEEYLHILKLKKYEYMAIKSLGLLNNVSLLKQGEHLSSCNISLHPFRETIAILSDNAEIQKKILNIKENIQTEDPERWVPSFYYDIDIKTQNILNKDIIDEIHATNMMRSIIE